MANKKKIAAKSKTKTSKYSKLMAAASKELTDKKKALAKAEKTLAKASQTHQELLQETARLDMLERSLKALVEGTEPPQNVRYIYTYPQWVWTPNTWYQYPYNGTYTITCGNLQGGSLLTNCNVPVTATTGSNAFTTGVTTTSNGYGLNSTAYNCSSAIQTEPSSLSYGDAGQVLTCSNAGPTWQTVNTAAGTSDFTVDLSTGATEDEPVTEEAVEVGHGV